MAETTGQERSEKATAKRRQEAREEGNVPRSRELTTTAVLLTAAAGLLLLGGHMAEGLNRLLHTGLNISKAQIFSDDAVLAALKEGMVQALTLMAPLLLMIAAAAILAPMALGGFTFSTKALGFNPARMDPIKGLQKVFGPSGFMEVIKALVKFALVAGVSVAVLWHWYSDLMSLGQQAVGPALTEAAHLIGWSLLLISAAMLLVVAADVPFQLWNFGNQIKMTRQEVKDEFKETEGRPEVKGRIRQLQREYSRRRMMAAVPKADVIVVNPEHFAVALRYDQTRMGAPVVVAKGVDYLALEIRAVARAHRVPILSAPALARAIYYSTDLDKEIPAGLYVAAAKVLAYVYQLRAKGRRTGDRPLTMKDELPIPEDLRRDT